MISDKVTNLLFKGMLTICIIGFFAALTAIPFACHHDAALYDECRKDGHKEYECRAMIDGGVRRTIAPIPVFIPPSRGH